MKYHSTAVACLTAIALSGAAWASIPSTSITMSVAGANGEDNWGELSNFKLLLTIECADLNTAASASSAFTLTSWHFRAYADNIMDPVHKRYEASGSATQISFQDLGATKKATINLTGGTVTTNLFAPQVDSLSFEYMCNLTDSLRDAIEASAGTPAGQLTLSNNDGITGLMGGVYAAVPAPGAAVLMLVGAAFSRHRRRA